LARQGSIKLAPEERAELDLMPLRSSDVDRLARVISTTSQQVNAGFGPGRWGFAFPVTIPYALLVPLMVIFGLGNLGFWLVLPLWGGLAACGVFGATAAAWVPLPPLCLFAWLCLGAGWRMVLHARYEATEITSLPSHTTLLLALHAAIALCLFPLVPAQIMVQSVVIFLLSFSAVDVNIGLVTSLLGGSSSAYTFRSLVYRL